MITVQKVIRLVRFKEKDNDEVKYSDYDIIQSLNEVLGYMSIRLSEMNSDFLEKAVVLDEKKINEQIAAENEELPEGEEERETVIFPVTGVDLPDDFLTLIAVKRLRDDYRLKCTQSGSRLRHDEYYIMGNKLYCRCHCVKLLYRRAIEQIAKETDTIDLPESFLLNLAKMTSMVLHNNAQTDVLREALDSVIDSMIIRRRYSNPRIKPPFMV